MSDLTKYATVSWTVDDVLCLSEDTRGTPTITEAAAEAFLERNSKYIQDRLIELGWDVLDTYMNMDGLL